MAGMQEPDGAGQCDLGGAQDHHLAAHPAQARQPVTCSQSAAVKDRAVEILRDRISLLDPDSCLRQCTGEISQRLTGVEMGFAREEQSVPVARRKVWFEFTDMRRIHSFVPAGPGGKHGEVRPVALWR
jgi:hypothetical protein